MQQLAAFYASSVIDSNAWGFEDLNNEFLLDGIKMNLAMPAHIINDPTSLPVEADYDGKISGLFTVFGSEATVNAWDMLHFMLGWVGEIQYLQDLGGGDEIGLPFTGPTVSNVRIGLSNKAGPGKILLAPSSSNTDLIKGADVVTLGSQAGVQFYNNVDFIQQETLEAGLVGGEVLDGPGNEGITGYTLTDPIARPDFGVHAGEQDFLTLYGADGILGGRVQISTDNQRAIPFWLAYVLEPNEQGGTTRFNLGIRIDEE
jgi:hypothetical protein